ncbi:MAG: carbohydrate-binding module family 20 domain-containing protein, partial [Bacteroidota bacterium]
MLLQFNIHYLTTYGQRLVIKTNHPKQTEIELHYQANGQWQGEWETGAIPAGFNYMYILMEGEQLVRQEMNQARSLAGVKGDQVIIEDSWQASELPASALYTSAFEEVVFKPQQELKTRSIRRAKGKVKLHLRMLEIRVPTHLTLAVTGNTEELGNWGTNGAVKLANDAFPLWQSVMIVRPGEYLEYKYVLVDKNTGNIVHWESGPNRTYTVPLGADVAVKTDVDLATFTDNWKGSGVAMPVFSLRTQNSYGSGEFTDIKLLVDWAKKVGMQM